MPPSARSTSRSGSRTRWPPNSRRPGRRRPSGRSSRPAWRPGRGRRARARRP
jgi:hypothetical protein